MTNSRDVGRLVLAAAVALLVGGCGTATPSHAGGSHAGGQHSTSGSHAGGEHSPSTRATEEGKPAAVLTVQQLATALGCEAKLVGKTTDFHQANCTAAEADLVLLDFTTADGQRAWLDHAMAYGGRYLVGERWVVASDEPQEYLRTLQGTLGGDIETGDI